jgi:hypothetical protein
MERFNFGPATLRDDLASLTLLIEDGREGQAGEICDTLLSDLRAASGTIYPRTRNADSGLYVGIAIHIRACLLNINIRRLDLAAQNVRDAIGIFEIRFPENAAPIAE